MHHYYYDSQTSLQEHLQTFIDAYNFAKRLKSLNGLTPWEFIVKVWKSNPKSFKIKSDPYNLGLDTDGISIVIHNRPPKAFAIRSNVATVGFAVPCSIFEISD